MELDLRDGRRRSGRRPGPNPKVMHRRRKGLDPDFAYHVTLRVLPGIQSLRTPRVVREIEASFRKACDRGKFRLVEYSLQDDHAHLIVEAKNAGELGRGMMSLGARLARAVNRALRRTGRVLADRYHLMILQWPKQVRNALRYVLLNARKHWRGSVRNEKKTGPAPLDAASSARWFTGWSKDVDRSTPTGLRATPAVAKPTVWVLKTGWWKHHGHIDPRDIPGPA